MQAHRTETSRLVPVQANTCAEISENQESCKRLIGTKARRLSVMHVYHLLFSQVAETWLMESGLNIFSWPWLSIVPVSFTVWFTYLSSWSGPAIGVFSP